MSDLTTAGIGVTKSAACAATVAACFTGLDVITVLGALCGAMLSTFEDEQRTDRRLLWTVICIVLMSFLAVAFLVDILPAVTRHFQTPVVELGLGRGFVAALFAYFAQRVILPGLGRVIKGTLSMPGIGRVASFLANLRGGPK